ncbi:MAG: hypothetical protein U9R29_03630 [Thermodesulfobacteriota bacterium]|nr:hypothetical protein [Thermodesulfobacteriota bacterium]
MKIETTEIRELPIAHKVELLEIISEAIFHETDSLQSPAWHEDVLKIREAELNDESQWLSLDELRKSLRS